MGDFIVMRSDHTPTYNLAATIDDILMKISHVIRGEDHMSNTPKQILMMRALGFSPPIYAHLPILLAEDGTKLSKRHRHSAFGDLIGEGYLPEALLNFLMLMGWHPEDNKEDLAADGIICGFALEKVSTRAAHYSVQKLGWLNKQKIMHAEPERLLAYGKRFVKKHAAAFSDLPVDTQLSLLSAVRENISRLDELDAELAPFFEFTMDGEAMAEARKHPAKEVATALLPLCGNDDFKSAMNVVSSQSGAKGKALYLPARAALSGRSHGPELAKLYQFLPPAERAARIKRFLELLDT
jgi:nondiscriminating glutamyl-tRNA synthetase